MRKFDFIPQPTALYVFIPLPLAAAINLEAGEEFQWSLADRNTPAVHRIAPHRTARSGPARRDTSQGGEIEEEVIAAAGRR